MKKIILILKLVALLFTTSVISQVRASDTFYGAGAYTTGARNDGSVTPTIVHVTNLNDSGTGSFREALLLTIPRYIVFDVSGVIELDSQIYLNSSRGNLTVNGFTAPEGGITILGYAIICNGVDNIIWRGIRFRNGYNPPTSWTNATELQHRACTNVMVDRCSFAYAKYGTEGKGVSFITNGATEYGGNATIQNCLIGFSYEGYMIGNSADGVFGDVTCYRNVSVNTFHRHPKIGAVNYGDVVNNIVHGWGWRALRVEFRPITKLNLINNRFTKGHNLNSENYGGNRIHGHVNYGGGKIYEDGNYIDISVPNYTTQPWNAWFNFPVDSSDPNYDIAEGVDGSEWVTSRISGISGEPLPTLLTSTELKDELLPKVGACSYIDDNGVVGFYRDDTDTDLITNVTNNTTNIINSSQYKGLAEALLISTVSNTRSAGFSTLNDGIEDSWRTANMSGEAATDINPATSRMWIEDFYNQIDGDVVVVNRPIITRTDSNPDEYIVGESFLGISGAWSDVEDGTGTATYSGTTIDINTAGTYNQYLSHTDSDGNLGQLFVPITYTEAPVPAVSVTVSPSNATIAANEAVQLTAVVNGSSEPATDQTGIWSSSDTALATVNSNTGYVTGISNGTATISFTSTENVVGSATITISGTAVMPQAAIIDSVVLSDGDYTISFSTATGTEVPSGNYNTYVTSSETGGVRENQDDNDLFTGFTRTITGLNTSIAQTFEVDARYFQYDPAQFYMSNAVTVAPQASSPPFINLNGSSIVYYNLGDVYNELGAEVSDNTDAGLVPTITGIQNGDIITSQTGYYAYYNVTNSNGVPAAQKVRTIVVNAPVLQKIRGIHPVKRLMFINN